jgi:hypothetical protein
LVVVELVLQTDPRRVALAVIAYLEQSLPTVVVEVALTIMMAVQQVHQVVVEPLTEVVVLELRDKVTLVVQEIEATH